MRESSENDPNEWRRIYAAEHPVEWIGDLSDDCTARWAGFMLRAEEMSKACWWWCVYDMETPGETQIATSKDDARECTSGEMAPSFAEEAARAWLAL